MPRERSQRRKSAAIGRVQGEDDVPEHPERYHDHRGTEEPLEAEGALGLGIQNRNV
jgi:hypothetical protein